MDQFEVQQQPQKSKRKLVIVLGVIILLIIPIVAGVAYFTVTNNGKQETTATDMSSEQKPEVTVASKKEVNDNISTLNTSLTQASSDQSTAKAALKDATNQAKVAN